MSLSRRTGHRFQGSVWPGFVDAMTGLLMVLTFVLTIFMVVQFVLRETISGQEHELDALADEVGRLAQALGLEERTNNQLQARLGALNATLNDAQDDLTQAQALIASLTVERDQQRAALDDAATRITAFEAQVAALLSDREQTLGTVAALEEQRATLLSEQEALNLALAQARSEIDDRAEAARLAAARREALEAMIADLEREGDRSAARIGTLEQQLSAEEAARLAEAAAAEALRDKLKNADAELTAMTLALEAQRKQAEDTLTLLAAADAAKAQLDERLSEVLAEIEAARAQLHERDELAERLTRVLAQMEVAQSESQARVNALSAELDRIRAEGEQTRTDLAAARARAADTQGALEAALAEQRAATVATRSQYQVELERLQSEYAAARIALEGEMAELRALADATRTALEERLAQSEEDAAGTKAALEAELARARADLAAAQNAAVSTEEDRASVEARLLAALETLERAQAAASDQEVLQQRLLAALNAQTEAEASAAEQRSLAEQRADLLAQARAALGEEQVISAEAQRQTALLNQQVAALRSQLGSLQALLDDYKSRNEAAQVQVQTLGQDLNAALARAASEERKRRILEEAERKRLEAEAIRLAEEAKALEAQAKDLEQYRSEFFGRLRGLLGDQEGVRIEGDRFVFSSEVLFDPGSADLSPEGQFEIAKVARILRGVAAEIPPEIDWVIRVDGHTDNVPLSGTGRFADNWELSQGRALSVVRYMVDFLGIAPDRLSANGFGEYQPINPADTPEARAQNRRIELKLTEK